MFNTYFRTKNDKTKIHGIYTLNLYILHIVQMFIVFCTDAKLFIIFNIWY